ncbi:extracellular solute-binding protein [Halanaerobium sp. Z-7514]|uniref:Extracellular solute-binding protein n=1 Tax=Halanaerobium polyolivorans TaxID=2886943 RepID=A0AAW4WSP7_9FIRM|nr:extracellular solute-binding protein [Halanaerobium polyolivorans]MCC3144132.1 extracellular solute-binding protein [Halanaerobium polyolivorans]
MKLIKKIFFLILVFIVFLSFNTKAETQIEFWTINLSPQYDQYFLNKIAEFEAQNPELKIKWEDISFSSIQQKLRQKISEGKAPQVVNLSPQLMSALVYEDLLYAISNFEQNYGAEYFINLWESNNYDGEIYAFPWYVSTRIMAYNKEIFKIAGLNPEDFPQNQSDFFETARKLKVGSGVYAFMPQLQIHEEFKKAGLNIFELNNDKPRAAFNNDKAVAIVAEYQNLAKERVVPADSLNSSFNIALDRYLKNELAVLITAPQFLKEIEAESNYLKDMTALAAIPSGEGELINASLMNLVIPKTAENKAEAAEFAAFITGAEAQREFSKITGLLPSAKNAVNTDFFLENNSEAEEISLTDQARYLLAKELENMADMTLLIENSSALTRAMNEQFARAFADKITAQEAVDIMEQRFNEILD